MIELNHYGWNSFHQQNFNAYNHNNNEQLVGRVISIRGFKYYLNTTNGELETELAGKLLYGVDLKNLPKVGDWDFYLDYGATGFITDMLPKTECFIQKGARQ